MDWETGVTFASSLLTASAKLAEANATVEANNRETEYKASNIANQALRHEGALKTSFLQSGIALDPNTAVNKVFQDALDQGATDINRLSANNTASNSNALLRARLSALQGLGNTGVKYFGGGDGFDAPNNDAAAYQLNSLGYGNAAYSMLDPTPGP